MRRIPVGLADPEAGAILVLVLCPTCGSRVIALVQERWTTETPGELLDAWALRAYAGKVRRLDGTRGHTIGTSPLRKDPQSAGGESTILCRRHGVMLVSKAALARAATAKNQDTPRAVVAEPLKRSLD